MVTDNFLHDESVWYKAVSNQPQLEIAVLKGWV